MRKSSLNFKKSKISNFYHNDRTIIPSYVIDNSNKNFCPISADESVKLVQKYYSNAKKNYKEHFGQKLQAKSYLWEAVINLDAHHKPKDIVRLANILKNETKFEIVQIAMHSDEGHISEDNQKIYNYHAHIIFFTLDKYTGKQLYRRSVSKSDKAKEISYPVMNRARLAKLQDLTAEVLGMERGEKNSGKIRLEHKEYRERMIVEGVVQKIRKKNLQLKNENRTLKTENNNHSRYLEMLEEDFLEIFKILKIEKPTREDFFKKLEYLMLLDTQNQILEHDQSLFENTYIQSNIKR